MAEVRWLNEDEARMWRSLRLMFMRLDQVVEQQLSSESGLSGADYALLVPLSELPEGEGLRARDLAHGVSWDRSRLSHQLRRMQERGLVDKRDCPTDARGSLFFLTAAGRAAIVAAAPSHVETVRRVFVDLLTPAEVAVLSGIAERVLQGFDAVSPETSPCASTPEPVGPAQ